MIEDDLDSIDKNIQYVSESISYMSVKDFNIASSGYQDQNLMNDIISLRFYLLLLKNYRWYLKSNQERPDFDIKIVIEKAYGLIQNWLGLEYQWSLNDN